MTGPDIAATLEKTIAEYRDWLLGLGDATVQQKPTHDRWSIAEVMGHLIDSACNNHQRFVRAQESSWLTFPNYEQNFWVIAGNYHDTNWSDLVNLWYYYNKQLARIMCRIPDSSLSTPCTISPYNPCTLEFLITDYVNHLNHHLIKIRQRIDPAG